MYCLVQKTTAQCCPIHVNTYNWIYFVCVCVKETMEAKCFVMLPTAGRLFVRKTSAGGAAQHVTTSNGLSVRDAVRGKAPLLPMFLFLRDNTAACGDRPYCPSSTSQPHDRSEGAEDGIPFLVCVLPFLH